MTTQPDLDQRARRVAPGRPAALRPCPGGGPRAARHDPAAQAPSLVAVRSPRRHGPRHTPGRSQHVSAMRPHGPGRTDRARNRRRLPRRRAESVAGAHRPLGDPGAHRPLATPSPTAAPSTKPLTGLLARLVTEEVEPGVLRVVSDGYRDVSLDLYSAPATGIRAVGPTSWPARMAACGCSGPTSGTGSARQPRTR